MESALRTLPCATLMSLLVLTRAARTIFFGSCMPCPPSPWHPVRPPTAWLAPERSAVVLGVQGWMGHGRTQITLQGDKCQKMNEKHQMACQIYLFTLFSRSQATFDHNIFWASTFPLLRYPWALSTPSQTLWCAHEHGLRHLQETSQASRGAVGGCVGKKTSQSSCRENGWREVWGCVFSPFSRVKAGDWVLWLREDG